MMERAALILRMLRLHALDVVFAVILMFAIFAMGIYTAQSDVVAGSLLLKGSSVNGIDISGMDPDQAYEKVLKAEEERLLGDVRLVLVARGREYVYDAEALGATTNAREVLSGIIGATSGTGLTERTAAYFRLRDGAEGIIEVLFDYARVEAICREFSNQFYRAPVDASLRLSEQRDSFDYVPDQDGAYVDRLALYQQVRELLSHGVSGVVEVEIQSTGAEIPLQSLIDNTMLLSSFETRIADGQSTEVLPSLAARLNGYAMQKSENIALRSILYPRGSVPKEEEAAAAQIAGTLYDALLLAGAEKVERHPNDRPPEYMEKGLDAALDDQRDLVMANNAKFPLYILAGVDDGVLRIEVHGRLMRVDETIQLRTGSLRSIEPNPPIYIDDSSLPEGQLKLVTEAEEGYRVSSYREVLRGGKVISNELLSMDVYPAVEEVYHRGTAR